MYHTEIPSLSIQNCGRRGPGCLEVVGALYYLNNAYLTCTSETSSCYKKTFLILIVDGELTVHLLSFKRPCGEMLHHGGPSLSEFISKSLR